MMNVGMNPFIGQQVSFCQKLISLYCLYAKSGGRKGTVTLGNFSCNLSCISVATQIARIVAQCNMP